MTAAQQKLDNPNSGLVVRLKRHLKYGDTFCCIFPTWDATKNKVVLRNKRHHKIVHFLHILHFLTVWIQLYCTRTKATNLLEIAEAVGFATITLGCISVESEIHPDSEQTYLLNYICVLTTLAKINFFMH